MSNANTKVGNCPADWNFEEAKRQTKTAAQEYYEENGYYICRNLISHELIDQLLQRYQEEIVPSDYQFFRQTNSKFESHKFTEYGYIKQSFLDIHDYQEFPEFSRRARDIYTCLAIRDALTEVTGFATFNLMQTMLFDANTATVPHQDWWYLDSVPNGHLLGAWFALEDIDERAGRFFVLPKSMGVDLHSDTPDLSHPDWLKRVATYVAQHPEQIHAPEMKKGDVLFWNSRTIHGSLHTQDQRFSRKSLTAHYMPAEFKFGNVFLIKDPLEYKTYNGMKFYRTAPDYHPMLKMKSAIKSSPLYPTETMKKLRNLQKKS